MKLSGVLNLFKGVGDAASSPVEVGSKKAGGWFRGLRRLVGLGCALRRRSAAATASGGIVRHVSLHVKMATRGRASQSVGRSHHLGFACVMGSTPGFVVLWSSLVFWAFVGCKGFRVVVRPFPAFGPIFNIIL